MSNGSVLTSSDSIHVSNESAFNLALSRDEWSIIVQNLHIYDTIFVRASSKWLYKLCQQVRPFPRLYVLDQERCTDYIIKNGSLSLLDYVKTVLHFNWTSRHCSTAARFGHVSILKQLRADNCPWNDRTVLADCTQGTCSLDMIKYLHESGVSWQQLTPFHKYNEGYELLVSDMAKHGHVDCITYAMQNGCKDKYTHYIPTKECLDFVIDNNLDWKGDVDEHRSFAFAQPKSLSLPNICEEAATRGDINMLNYAHQRGALLKTSVSRATNVECLAYAVEHGKENELPFQWDVQSVDCFKYLLQKFGVEYMQKKINWHVICRNAELFKFVLDSGLSLPTDNFFVVDMWFSNAAESVESIKIALDRVPAELLKEIDVYSICARRGNLEGMKLAHELKLPMRPRQNGFLSGIPQVMMNAIRSNSVEVLKFVWENLVTNKETELNFNSFLLEAAHSTPEIIHYLTEQGANWTLKHLKEANNSCKLPILAYLMRTGTLKDSSTYDSYNFDSSICKKYVQEHGK